MATEPQIPEMRSVFEHSSPESFRSGRHVRAVSPLLESTNQSTSDDDLCSNNAPGKECSSSRSSISSFPASVIHNVLYTDAEDDQQTPSRPARNSPYSGNSYSAFRHPSSVRALQLESEYADSDVPHRSPKVSHSFYSTRSLGSPHCSPKRSSRSATPQRKSKLKKEFPLVLLHCTLLPPAVAAKAPGISDDILEAILPELYKKRWRMLQEKVVKNGEVSQRGVLIPHPRDDYDELEEKLLETLELERPRIRKGHYLSKSVDSDSGFESAGHDDSDEETADLTETCRDCGCTVSSQPDQERKWEIKVFAANGLMRSGAWAAAWEQMEKVDVEVSVWMPVEVRIEVEERLKALLAKQEAEKIETLRPTVTRERSHTATMRDERMREIYGEAPPQAETATQGQELVRCLTIPQQQKVFAPPSTVMHHEPAEDFFVFAKRHLKTIWNDQRNLAIVLLSVLVLFSSIQNFQQAVSFNGPEVPKAIAPASASQVTPTVAVELLPVLEFGQANQPILRPEPAKIAEEPCLVVNVLGEDRADTGDSLEVQVEAKEDLLQVNKLRIESTKEAVDWETASSPEAVGMVGADDLDNTDTPNKPHRDAGRDYSEPTSTLFPSLFGNHHEVCLPTWTP